PVFAENSRSPAVLDGSCNHLNIPLTKKEMVDGREILRNKTVQEFKEEQCIEVRKCMNSAPEEDMPELKNFEAVACNTSLKAISIKVPGIVTDKNFDGKREAKPRVDEKTGTSMPSSSSPK